MSTNWAVDFAFEQLNRNADIIRGAEDANEATTRLRAIDTVLFDVLGWDKLLVETEKYCRAEGYADYAFSQGKSICLILEAKKSAESFVLPNRAYDSTPVGMGLLARECPAAMDALTQATGYAARLGARYVVVSNGHQWLLTLSFVVNQPVGERLVWVFESLEAISNRFAHFFKCLGPEGVYSNSAASELLESRKAPAPAKRSAYIEGYPEPAGRNVIANELSYILAGVWDEVNQDDNDEAFLRGCYVRPGRHESAMALAKAILEQRRQTDQRVSREVCDASQLPGLAQERTPERPVVVLGGIGHGKSAFLKYLRLVGAKKELKGYIQLDVDFIDRPEKKEDVANHVYDEIERQLLEGYGIDITDDRVARGALHLQIARFRKTSIGKFFADDPKQLKLEEAKYIRGILEKRHSYLEHLFRHFKRGRDYSVAIFLDNLDQRSDSIQEEAFLVASAMARDWECLVLVCLRPGTFHRSRQGGVLDSVAPKTIVVAPPPVAPVLSRRFNYACEVAEGKHSRAGSSPLGAARGAIALDLPSAASLLECCARSVHKNRRLVSLLEAVANGNIRDLIHYTREILTSQHLNTRKILEEIPNGYIMPVHEPLRALLYGDFMHYNPATSMFINLFDLLRADPMEHFSRFLGLHYLSRQRGGASSKGFCKMEDVSQYLCQLGYSGDHATDTIRLLRRKRYCESRVPTDTLDDAEQEIRATSLGKYHVNHLVGTFQYIDAIIIDTPILDTQVRKELREERGIDRRLSRAEVFISYLDRCSKSLQDGEATELWEMCHDLVADDIKGIRERLARGR